jgi:hypothetical protein
LKAKRGSEQYQPMNSSMACAYDSCELAAASEFRTAFFDCSKSGSRSIVFARERLLVFFRRPILAASCAAFSMVIHSEADGLEPRFWISGLPTILEMNDFVLKCVAFRVAVRVLGKRVLTRVVALAYTSRVLDSCGWAPAHPKFGRWFEMKDGNFSGPLHL